MRERERASGRERERESGREREEEKERVSERVRESGRKRFHGPLAHGHDAGDDCTGVSA